MLTGALAVEAPAMEWALYGFANNSPVDPQVGPQVWAVGVVNPHGTGPGAVKNKVPIQGRYCFDLTDLQFMAAG